MGTLAYLLIAAAAAAPAVEVVTLDGKKVTGTLEALSGKAAKVNAGGQSTSYPAGDLMHVAFPNTKPTKTAKAPIRVTLTDGTSLFGSQVLSDGKEATFESAAFGKMTLPFTKVAQIRFKAATVSPKKEKQWAELIARSAAKDLLVIEQKETKVLDFLPVVVADITKEKVTFAFNGQTIPQPRSKFFGIIFARQKSAGAKPVCSVELASGDTVQVSKIGLEGETIAATLLAGNEVKLTTDKIRKLDFSLGKIKYLSDMEPSEVDVKPFFNDPFVAKLFQVRRNHTNTGKKLQLGKTTYERGLWIHSRTELKYRLGGEYRQFKAIMGIDQDVVENGKGHVRVVITGDEKRLLETTVRSGDEPVPVDLDVSKVINLTILVDYGENGDTSDHLDLCEARVIK